MFRKLRRSVPELNTTSTADISFMLLIFFLVTTSMDMDKGLARQLPPPTPPQEQESTDVAGRNVMKIKIANDNNVTINEQNVKLSDIKAQVEEFVSNPNNSDKLPEKSEQVIPLLGKCQVTSRHIIQLSSEQEANYDTYFTVQNEIVAAYNSLRNRLSHKRFGHSLQECSQEEKDALRLFYPQRISEVYQMGGTRP